MKYDFTSIIDRHGKDAIAVDATKYMLEHKNIELKDGCDVIPMWVADMNFATAPSIVEAVKSRLEHPLFGYFPTKDEYYDAIINWQKTRNHVEGLTKECIGYENGVLGGVASALATFAVPGDAILVHSPTYVGFTKTLSDNGFKIIHSPLVKDADGVWRMDYEDMAAKIKQHKIHAAIFCNPHNPCGRVGEPEEIQKAMEVYKTNDCVVISDEIWSDIILDGHRHTPTQSVSEDAKNRTIAYYAPTKTFNLAGFIGSYHIIYNSYLRDRLRSKEVKYHYNNLNVMSMYALIGGYSPEGMEWVDELCQVITENVDYACNYFKQKTGMTYLRRRRRGDMSGCLPESITKFALIAIPPQVIRS